MLRTQWGDIPPSADPHRPHLKVQQSPRLLRSLPCLQIPPISLFCWKLIVHTTQFGRKIVLSATTLTGEPEVLMAEQGESTPLPYSAHLAPKAPGKHLFYVPNGRDASATSSFAFLNCTSPDSSFFDKSRSQIRGSDIHKC